MRTNVWFHLFPKTLAVRSLSRGLPRFACLVFFQKKKKKKKKNTQAKRDVCVADRRLLYKVGRSGTWTRAKRNWKCKVAGRIGCLACVQGDARSWWNEPRWLAEKVNAPSGNRTIWIGVKISWRWKITDKTKFQHTSIGIPLFVFNWRAVERAGTQRFAASWQEGQCYFSLFFFNHADISANSRERYRSLLHARECNRLSTGHFLDLRRFAPSERKLSRIRQGRESSSRLRGESQLVPCARFLRLSVDEDGKAVAQLANRLWNGANEWRARASLAVQRSAEQRRSFLRLHSNY